MLAAGATSEGFAGVGQTAGVLRDITRGRLGGRQRRGGRDRAAHSTAEIGVEGVESLQPLLGVRPGGDLRQRQSGVGPLQTLNDLAQVVVAFGKPLRRLVGCATGGQRRDIELQTLRTQLEALQGAGSNLEIRTRQAACNGAHLGERRGTRSRVSRAAVPASANAPLRFGHGRRIAQKSRETGVFDKRSTR